MGNCVSNIEATRATVEHSPVVRRPFRAPGRSMRAMREYELGLVRDLVSRPDHGAAADADGAEEEPVEEPLEHADAAPPPPTPPAAAELTAEEEGGHDGAGEGVRDGESEPGGASVSERQSSVSARDGPNPLRPPAA